MPPVLLLAAVLGEWRGPLGLKTLSQEEDGCGPGLEHCFPSSSGPQHCQQAQAVRAKGVQVLGTGFLQAHASPEQQDMQ